jgi:hypothetical protein
MGQRQATVRSGQQRVRGAACLLVVLAAWGAWAQAPAPTFSIDPAAAPPFPIELLCTLQPPTDWRDKARFAVPPIPKGPLPEVFDLRPYCPPIRDQKNCGSCWAFATVGALECVIGVRDAVHVDLSEQYLISCNSETTPPHVLGAGTWGCNGGWFAHDYHLDKPDACGGVGAVLEADFPYLARDTACGCPYPRAYRIDDWAYVLGEDVVPSVEDIKRALLAYGPLSAAVYVGDLFYLYRGGVYNNFEREEVNHGVVLVGWDDTQGKNGAWILRNSWGTDWGIGGYMYIAYGCCSVGYGASFVEYSSDFENEGPTILRQPTDRYVAFGESYTMNLEAEGVGALHYQWFRDGRPVGEDAPECEITRADFEDAGAYFCRVSDLRGTQESRTAFLEVLPEGAVPGPSGVAVLLTAFALLATGIAGLTKRKPATQ